MFRWVAKLECQNSRLYQLIATLYSKPGADLDTFSRVALKSDGVDFYVLYSLYDEDSFTTTKKAPAQAAALASPEYAELF